MERKSRFFFWGPPNSGKTTWCSDYVKETYKGILDHLAIVSYDEPIVFENESNGALYNTGYKAEYDRQKNKASPNRFALKKAYRAHRADSQRIRSLSLKLGVEKGYHLCIDTTSSSDGIFKLTKALRAEGYEIHVVGMLAPLDLALDRSAKRLRLVEPNEVWSKRVGALGTFLKLLKESRKFVLFNNSGAHMEKPEFVLEAHGGGVVKRNNRVITEKVVPYLLAEPEKYRNHPRGKPYIDGLREWGRNFYNTLTWPLRGDPVPFKADPQPRIS